MTYLETAEQLYREAAAKPAESLCCVPTTPMRMPGLVVPDIMHAMNYGCGSTVHIADMRPNSTMLYVGVGGGLEVLQLAYFSRRAGGVIAIEPVEEMIEKARENLSLAAELNDWFDPAFVEIRRGNALSLPVDDNSVDFAAQNCLFNIFKSDGDLQQALAEVQRVIKPDGVLLMSDPITPVPLPNSLTEDERLRAACLSGCQTLDSYLAPIFDAGFGTIEVRSRRPYRLLDKTSYELPDDVMLESIEVACRKTKVPVDGPCIFTGRTATYAGPEELYNDGHGHMLPRNVPVAVCDKTAKSLADIAEAEIYLTGPTWHYSGGGCC